MSIDTTVDAPAPALLSTRWSREDIDKALAAIAQVAFRTAAPETLLCGEVDAIAYALIVNGTKPAAELFVADHAVHDRDPEQRHHYLVDWGYDGPSAPRKFVQEIPDNVRAYIENLAEEGPESDCNGCGEPGCAGKGPYLGDYTNEDYAND